MRKVTETGNISRDDGFARCEILPELDRIQALGKRRDTVWRYADCEIPHNAWQPLVRYGPNHRYAAGCHQPVTIEPAEVVRTNHDNGSGGHSARNGLDQVYVYAVRMHRTRIAEHGPWPGMSANAGRCCAARHGPIVFRVYAIRYQIQA